MITEDNLETPPESPKSGMWDPVIEENQEQLNLISSF